LQLVADGRSRLWIQPVDATLWILCRQEERCTFVAQGTNLLYSVEQPQSKNRWSPAKMIDVPLPSKAMAIVSQLTFTTGS
jgi:hypothetical protein